MPPREIERQLQPDVAGCGAIDTNQDIVKRHFPSPDHGRQTTLGGRLPESARFAVIAQPAPASANIRQRPIFSTFP
jgi:hypothetical protein